MNKALKSLRCKKLITQEEIALKLKVSRQTYNTYENNVKTLSITQIEQILNALDCTTEEIKEFFDAIQQDIKS